MMSLPWILRLLPDHCASKSIDVRSITWWESIIVAFVNTRFMKKCFRWQLQLQCFRWQLQLGGDTDLFLITKHTYDRRSPPAPKTKSTCCSEIILLHLASASKINVGLSNAFQLQNAVMPYNRISALQCHKDAAYAINNLPLKVHAYFQWFDHNSCTEKIRAEIRSRFSK